MRFFLALSLAAAAALQGAAACPLPAVSQCPPIAGYIDWNCDGKLKITALGDSIVSGRGDTDNGERGGYVLRLRKTLERKKLPAEVVARGYPGKGTARLISLMRQEQLKRGVQRLERALRGADLVIVDIGRNDWWLEMSPGQTARNIKRIATLAGRMGAAGGVAPLVVIAKLIPNERLEWRNKVTQQKFVLLVNEALMLLNQERYPVAVPFDQLPPYGYLQDPPRLDAGVHPTSRGYDILGEILIKFLNVRAQELMAAHRSDEDGDDVFSSCESGFYRTRPDSADSDGDGYTDGQELYELGSDPRDALDPPPAAPPPATIY